VLDFRLISIEYNVKRVFIEAYAHSVSIETRLNVSFDSIYFDLFSHIQSTKLEIEKESVCVNVCVRMCLCGRGREKVVERSLDSEANDMDEKQVK